MANYNIIKTLINQDIRVNGEQSVTGAILNNVLQQVVNTLGAGYRFGGFVLPDSPAQTSDNRVFYLGVVPGTYANFGGTVVTAGKFGYFSFDLSWAYRVVDLGAYVKPALGIPATDLTQAVQTSLGKADAALPASDVVDNLTTEDATKALSAKQGKVLDNEVSRLGQDLQVAIEGVPADVVNQLTGIDKGTPNLVIFQNSEAITLRLGTALETDTESPFKDLLGRKFTYYPAENATRYNRYVATGLFNGSTTNKVVFSYWVKKSEVLAESGDCVFVFSLWQTIYWNDVVTFAGLKPLINGGVGNSVTATYDPTGTAANKLKSVRTILFACELDGWCQIIQTHELTWYDSTLSLGIGVLYTTPYPSRISIVNPQVILNADAPIGKFVIRDVTDSVPVYPFSLNMAKEELDVLNERVDALTGEKRNFLHLTFTPDVESYILSPFNETHNAKLYFDVKRGLSFGRNRCFNFRRFCLVSKTTGTEVNVDDCSDDIAPPNFNSSYMGANHANAKPMKLTIASHGLTYANIGEVWNYGTNGQATILAVLDANNIVAVGKQTQIYPIFDFETIPADAVLSKDGTNLTVTASVLYQWFCATDTPDLDVFVDGERITQDGDYQCNDVKVCEAYNIYNTQSTLEKLRAGVGTYNENPNPATFTTADKCTRLTIAYMFPSAMQWFVATTFAAYQNITISRFGYTQQGPLSSAKLYIPKALPVEIGGVSVDFRTAPTYPAHTSIIYLTSETSETPNLPPDRWVTFNSDIAIHSGFLFDYGVGGTRRKDVVRNYFYLPSNMKIYPNGIDNKVTVNAGDSYSAINWRTFIDRSAIMTGGVISVNKFVYEGKLYIYADFNQTGIYEIEIPDEFIGKTVEIFEKGNNVTLMNPISGRKILVKIDTASPMYGYFVAQIK